MHIESSFNLEKKYISQGYDFVIGIDEVGRGPLAGPVVAAAAVIRDFSINPSKQISKDKNFIRNINLVRDSKTLSEKQRESLYDFICEIFFVGIGLCDHKTIDRINILEATYLAMKKALSDLKSKQKNNHLREKGDLNNKTIVLIDGNKEIPNLSIVQRAVVNGDQLVKTISAASIVAKVTRDRIMRETHQKFPEYCFDRHKGYGTKIHMEALKKYGPCEIHRKSFRPVAECGT